MSSAVPSKEKFCSLIGDIVDRSCNIIVDTEEALEYDAVELTVLLKSIGFRLNSFEFDTAPDLDSNNIEIDIKCMHSGITSRLVLSAKNCTCPERNKKTENNNSYWEIQGRGPQTPISRFKGIVKDTSCDLLPDISRKSANIARTTLAMLLQNYKTDFLPDLDKSKAIDVKTFAEYLNIKMPNSDELSSASRTISLPSIVENDNHVPKSQNAKNINSTKSDTNLSSNEIGCENNVNENKCDSEETSLISPSMSSLKSESLDLNEINFEFDYVPNERDKSLVKKILIAKKELDVALKMLKTKSGSSINFDRLSDITSSKIIPKQPKQSPNAKKSYSFPYKTSHRSSIGSTNETPNKSSPFVSKIPPRTNLTKRESSKAATKTVNSPKPIALRRTSSDTNLKPAVSNSGQVTKSNISKLSNSVKKL